MTREEEIKKAANSMFDIQDQRRLNQGFVKGAEWADQHPKEGLWDSEKVCKYLEEHSGHYMALENDEEGELQSVYYQRRLIEDLRKAMED